MKSKEWFPLLFIMFLVACNNNLDLLSNKRIENLPEMECYNSFEEFAYISPEISLTDSDVQLPKEPWQIETTIPNELISGSNHTNLGISVMFERQVNGDSEIWLARPDRYRKEDINSLFVYRPISKEWHTVQDKVANTDLFINEVYLTSDGAVWGRPMWEWWHEDEALLSKGPVLSKFNEQTQQFEFATGTLEVLYTNEYGPLDVKIVVDGQDKFWILVSNDGIYQYDPVNQKTTREKDLAGIHVANPVISPNGDIYFEDNNHNKSASANPLYSIYKGQYYRFNPESKELITLDIPQEPWPQGNLFVSQTGKIWFGAVGYKNLADNRWHLLHPDPDYHFDLGFWSHSPQVTLESSNGLLWFNKYTDKYRGTAWYDPETGKGCMFTNISAKIIEDQQQQLWMFADGTLYSLSLAAKE